MNCRKEWRREIQIRELTATFVKGPLTKHMENVLFDSQRALLPATLEIYERERAIKVAREESAFAKRQVSEYRKQSKLDDAITAATEQLHELFEQRDKLTRWYKKQMRDGLTEMADKVSKRITAQHDIRSKLEDDLANFLKHDETMLRLTRDHARKLSAYRAVRYAASRAERAAARAERAAQPGTDETVAPRQRFTRACPADGCRGFLSTQWKCGLCELWTCPDCLVVKGPERDCEHCCNPDDVASAKLLSVDSKPCPKCACVIFKVDGCDQMWCTMCHTAFSWRTGNIETRTIHNPHFFEYQRSQRANIPRAVGDIPCGRDLDVGTLQYLHDLLQQKGASREFMLTMYDYINAAQHMNAVELPRFRPDRVVDFRNLRIKYISSEITESTFRLRLFREMKKQEYKREVGEVLQMLSITLHELMHRFIQEITPEQTMEDIYSSTTIVEIDRLFEYANGCLLNIAKVYDAVPYYARVFHPDPDNERFRYAAGVFRVSKPKATPAIQTAQTLIVH
jgi:hypothetical protein